jgi:hypothetical protein
MTDAPDAYRISHHDLATWAAELSGLDTLDDCARWFRP